MVQGDETTATQVFQIKLNKQGLISGEYYNATTDQTTPISGSVDNNSQRAAWTIGDKKTPVYEAGIANLTKSETTMMVDFGKAAPSSSRWCGLNSSQRGNQADFLVSPRGTENGVVNRNPGRCRGLR